jgi:hypothetical protein
MNKEFRLCNSCEAFLHSEKSENFLKELNVARPSFCFGYVKYRKKNEYAINFKDKVIEFPIFQGGVWALYANRQ